MSSEEEYEESLVCGVSTLGIQGYQYEPVLSRKGSEEQAESESSSSSESESQDNTDSWCHCQKCQLMPTPAENRCCHSYPKVLQLMEGRVCITDHPGFAFNCLGRWVLLASMHEYTQHDGPIGDEVPLNDVFRYLAYRRFVFLVWHKLGKRNRRVLPSCVVNAVRKAYRRCRVKTSYLILRVFEKIKKNTPIVAS